MGLHEHLDATPRDLGKETAQPGLAPGMEVCLRVLHDQDVAGLGHQTCDDDGQGIGDPEAGVGRADHFAVRTGLLEADGARGDSWRPLGADSNGPDDVRGPRFCLGAQQRHFGGRVQKWGADGQAPCCQPLLAQRQDLGGVLAANADPQFVGRFGRH